MGFKCGIVGLPNVGKSTLFNALTQAGIESANYPFCTIEPNVGVVPMPDPRLDALAKIVNPQQVLKFLANIRETQAIGHVVRCFDDDDITHVEGSIDPLRDIETIDTELALADMETVEKAIQRVAKQTKSGDKEAIAKKALFEQVQKHLDTGAPVRAMGLDDDQLKALYDLHLLTIKPTMYIANVADDGFTNNPWLDQVHAHAEKEGAVVVPVCAAIEAEITELSDDEKEEFMADLGLEEPGLDRVIRAGYELLKLQTYFTAGEKEVRAWTVRVGATAPQGAGVIHTDFERGFIRAEVIAYDDFIANGGEQGAKEAGKWRLEGKEYIIQDGDVIHFRFNV